MFSTTTLKPQNLVQNTNSKTHLTNHCFGIRRGKNLIEVVKATGENTNPHSHISILQDTTQRNQSRINKIDRKESYIVYDLFYESSTIYQDEYVEKCMANVIGGEFLRSLRFTRHKVIEHQIPINICIQKIKTGQFQFIALLMNSLLVFASHGELIGYESCESDPIYQKLQLALERCKKYADLLSNETDTPKRIMLCNYLLCELHRYLKTKKEDDQESSLQEQNLNLEEINQSMQSEVQTSSSFPKGETSPMDQNKLHEHRNNQTSSSENHKLEELYKKLAEDNLEQKVSRELQQEAKEIYLKQVKKSGVVAWHYIVERNLDINEYMIKTYENYYHEIKSYALKTKRMLLKILNDKKPNGIQKGYTIGRFNTSSYVNNMYSKNGRSFSRNNAPNEKPDVVFGLIIDESGSMEGEKIMIAKKSAILFEEVLSSIHVPYMILGHTGFKDKSYLYIYHDFNNYDHKDKYRRINIKYRNRNRDGATIKYACEKLKQREEKHKILIVITDGAPTEIGFHHVESEEDDVRLTVKEESKDILIFGAVIDGEIEAMEYMYKDRILDLTDLKKLPNALCKLIKRNIK